MKTIPVISRLFALGFLVSAALMTATHSGNAATVANQDVKASAPPKPGSGPKGDSGGVLDNAIAPGAILSAKSEGDAREPCKFGETVSLAYGMSLVVTQKDLADIRSRYPAEFPLDKRNFVAFEFRFLKSEATASIAVYYFATDRADPTHSDIVVQCGSERVNIFKLGSVMRNDPNKYAFGRPGFFQAKDGRWGSIGSDYDDIPLTAFFELPAPCASGSIRLLVGLDVSPDGNKEQKHHQLLFVGPSLGQPPQKL